MTQLMSPYAFKWFLTFLTGSLAGIWFVYDAIKLVRLRPDTPSVGDKRFGYAMGVVIGAIGVTGCLLFWNVL
ncbi:MAG TPA: hypothetical protein VLT45_23205 [Kofleriaceae bacterium]|nr:hypothetical protein [Kofleriaceae bacterium]